MKRILAVVMIVSVVLSVFAVLTPKARAPSAGFSLLWTRNTTQTVQGMAAADLNGDGKGDVVYSDWSGMVDAVDSNNNTLWNFKTGWYNDLRIGDLRGDGNKEVVIGSADDHVYCLNGTTGQQIWNYPTAELAGHSMSLADIYGNGEEEVIMGEWDSNVYSASPANMYVLDPNGNLLWKHTFPDDVVTSSADVNNDGKAEVFAYYGRPQIASTAYLYRFNSDGTVNWTASIPGCAWMIPIFLDVNGDGIKEIITCRNSDNAILVFSSIDGSLLNTISNSYGPLWWAGDLNNDGQVEFLTNSGNTLYALDFSGNMIWGSPLSSGVYDLKVADLNGDGKKEIVAGTTGFLYVLSSQGSTLWSTAMIDDVGSIQIADIDGDGLPDIVAGTGRPWPDQAVPEIVSVFKQAPPIPGDLNGDGHVNLADISQMVLWYGMTSSNPNWNVPNPPWVAPSAADYNGNGRIDLVDLVTEAMYYSIYH
jgi:outer membrane protein assembly factor BamB